MSLHNNPGRARAFTRREFIDLSARAGALLASASVAAPAFIQRSAQAMALQQAMAGGASIPGVPEERILVVVQLSGGNDGLNTVIPFRDDDYFRARPQIAIREPLTLERRGYGHSEGVGLHPGLAPVKEMYDQGLVSVVQGVGYPNPNRSHFTSMDIWHTADTSGVGDGWLGRYIDSECVGFGAFESGGRGARASASRASADAGQGAAASAGSMAEPAIAIGRESPLALEGRLVKPVSFDSPDLFRWTGEDVHEVLKDPYHEINSRGMEAGHAPESNAAFLTRTALDAQVSSEAIRRAVSQRPLVQYPNSQLAQQLQMVASMIRAGMKTRVYYVSHGGFDTHADQGGANGRHEQLLNQFASAVRAFYADLTAQENHGRVLTMSFSEFGRRVGQNASRGTDHGTAAPMFLFGPMVKPGVLTRHPSLTDLDYGDLKFNTDFRSVYAGLLDGWMKGDSEAALGKKFRPLEVLRA